MVQAKKRMVYWVVSNCDDDPSERMKLVRSIQKFIPVDIYGKCGKPLRKCDSCKDQLSKESFFYLAFENSLALDYISEKTFKVMGKGTIPVVYGGANYTNHLPPKSYINAQDFKSTKELSEFLIQLAGDTEEYMSYFWWTQYYQIYGHGYSDLCEKLVNFQRGIGKRVYYYKDLEEWEHKGTWFNRTIEIS